MNADAMKTHDLAWAGYPERDASPDAPALRDAWRWLRALLAWPSTGALPQRHARAIAAQQARLARADAATVDAATLEARRRLSVEGFTPPAIAAALGLAAAQMTRTLNMTPYPTQLHAAWLIVHGRFAEMATGEGKTLAAALAAAVGALAGWPVHVMTANDYLVQRDRELLEPYYRSLGLTSSCVLPVHVRAERAAAYRCNVVHVTAKELVFDYLKDHQMLGGERDVRVLHSHALDDAARQQPMLPGLCFGVIDEADSILLDEACMPLILAAPTAPVDEAGYRRAFQIASGLQRQRDYQLLRAGRQAALTDEGRARVTQQVLGEAGVLAPPRRAHELVEAAIAARS